MKALAVNPQPKIFARTLWVFLTLSIFCLILPGSVEAQEERKPSRSSTPVSTPAAGGQRQGVLAFIADGNKSVNAGGRSHNTSGMDEPVYDPSDPIHGDSRGEAAPRGIASLTPPGFGQEQGIGEETRGSSGDTASHQNPTTQPQAAQPQAGLTVLPHLRTRTVLNIPLIPTEIEPAERPQPKLEPSIPRREIASQPILSEPEYLPLARTIRTFEPILPAMVDAPQYAPFSRPPAEKPNLEPLIDPLERIVSRTPPIARTPEIHLDTDTPRLEHNPFPRNLLADADNMRPLLPRAEAVFIPKAARPLVFSEQLNSGNLFETIARIVSHISTEQPVPEKVMNNQVQSQEAFIRFTDTSNLQRNTNQRLSGELNPNFAKLNRAPQTVLRFSPKLIDTAINPSLAERQEVSQKLEMLLSVQRLSGQFNQKFEKLATISPQAFSFQVKPQEVQIAPQLERLSRFNLTSASSLTPSRFAQLAEVELSSAIHPFAAFAKLDKIPERIPHTSQAIAGKRSLLSSAFLKLGQIYADKIKPVSLEGLSDSVLLEKFAVRLQLSQKPPEIKPALVELGQSSALTSLSVVKIELPSLVLKGLDLTSIAKLQEINTLPIPHLEGLLKESRLKAPDLSRQITPLTKSFYPKFSVLDIKLQLVKSEPVRRAVKKVSTAGFIRLVHGDNAQRKQAVGVLELSGVDVGNLLLVSQTVELQPISYLSLEAKFIDKKVEKMMAAFLLDKDLLKRQLLLRAIK